MQERVIGGATAAGRSLPAVALVLALVPPAAAEWTADQRLRFLASCVQGCQSAPDMTTAARSACPSTCNCIANLGEKTMTPADFDEAEKAAAQQKMTAKAQELSIYFGACARRALD